MLITPEAIARETIDAALTEAGWIVQDVRELNRYAGRGVAVREVSLKSGHGEADYLLFVDRPAIGRAASSPAIISTTRSRDRTSQLH